MELTLRDPSLACAGLLDRDIDIILLSTMFYLSRELKNKKHCYEFQCIKIASLWKYKMTIYFSLTENVPDLEPHLFLMQNI